MTTPGIEISHNQPLMDLVQQATSNHELITLTEAGETKAVLLSIEAFEHLMGMRLYQQRQLMPLEEFQQQFHQALVEAGYDSREKIIDLVQVVKQELAAEREQARHQR